MRVADGAKRVLEIRRLLRLPPVVRDFVKAEALSRADIVERALAAAEFMAHTRKAGADEDHAVGVVALGGDDRLLFRAHTPGLCQALVVTGPVIVAVGRKFD